MAPEYGATMGFFPVDDATVDYLRFTGRTDAEVEAFAAYFKAQGLFGMPLAGEIDYTKVARRSTSRRSSRRSPGPKRPQDRIELGNLKQTFTALFSKPVAENGFSQAAARLAQRYPADLDAAGSARRRPLPPRPERRAARRRRDGQQPADAGSRRSRPHDAASTSAPATC